MKYFVLRGASKRTKLVTSFALALVLVFQALGPGVFAVNVVLAGNGNGNGNGNSNQDNNKVTFCHKDDKGNWSINSDSQGSGDFTYGGTYDNKGHGDDKWCSDHSQDNQDNDHGRNKDAAKVMVSKIICPTEAELPNWGLGTGPDITSKTATDFLASHQDCHLDTDWQFQWGPSTSTDPGGAVVGPASGPWSPAFSGHTFVPISSAGGSIHVREVLQSGFIPFTYDAASSTPNGNNYSAEMYCSNDHRNYDNFDFINSPEAGDMYYCVAWNVPVPACVASSGIISSDTTTMVTSILTNGETTTPNTGAVLVTPTPITSQYWTATSSDPNAKWIWSEDPVTGWTVDKTVTFTKTFDITGNPSAITGSLQVAADNNYDVSVNGTVVDANVINSFSGPIHTYDVSADLHAGSNTITFTVTNTGQAGDAVNNPGGLLYSLSWNGSCGGGENGGGGDDGSGGATVQVHIAKYLNGVQATAESANSYAFPMTSTWSATNIGSGTGSYTLSPTPFGPAGDSTVGPYQADTAYMSSGATYSTQEVTNNIDASSKVLPYGASCVAGDYQLDGYGVSKISFADAWAHVAAPSTFPGNQPSFGTGLNSDAYIVVANHTCPVTPPTPVGTLKITKYECPADTTITRANNGPSETDINNSEYTVPNGCVPEAGMSFGYTYDPSNNTNNTGPYLGLNGDTTPFTPFAPTDSNGVTELQNATTTGRYIIVELDSQGKQLPANQMLGLYCYGDGDTSATNDNQEITFAVNGKVSNCVAYNFAPVDGEGSQSGALTVTKVVVGGDKQVSDFPLFVDGNPVTSGVPDTGLSVGNHVVTETNTDSNYVGVFSGGCDANGNVAVTDGGSANCTLTNTYTPSQNNNLNSPTVGDNDCGPQGCAPSSSGGHHYFGGGEVLGATTDLSSGSVDQLELIQQILLLIHQLILKQGWI
jgi:hypothetical protein